MNMSGQVRNMLDQVRNLSGEVRNISGHVRNISGADACVFLTLLIVGGVSE